MGLRINTNLSSLNAQRNLESVTGRLADSYRRLSSGLRITVAADDAAGLAISERLRSQVRSLDQARRNALDGISLSQTTEGALHEAGSMLIRMRELSMQAANGTVSAADRETLDEEFQALVAEIDRIARSTDFNGVRPLDGSATSVRFHIGFGDNTDIDTVQVSLSPALSTSLGLSGLDIGSGGNPGSALAVIDAAIDSVSSLRGGIGAAMNRLGSTIANLGIAMESLTASESRIRDVDVAVETSNMTRDSILQQAAISVLAQANTQPQAALSLLG